MISTLRALLGYLICGLTFGLPLSLLAIPALCGSSRAFKALYGIDIAICALCHNTMLESISGRSYRFKAKRRYRYQMQVIDLLALLVGDGKDHCKRAYEWEVKYIKLPRER